MTSGEQIKAQSELADLQKEVVKLLLEKGAKLRGTTYDYTIFEYHNFEFSLQIEFLGLSKDSTS